MSSRPEPLVDHAAVPRAAQARVLPHEAAPSRGPLLAAFVSLYVVWGSTYLAMRYAVQSIPPFLMAGSRFLVSGALLVAWARWRQRDVVPTRAQWKAAAVTGLLLLFGGNGGVAWSEQRVPSGIAALLVAAVPVWMVLMDWLRPGGRRPHGAVFAGLLLGLLGLVVLVDPGAAGATRVDRIGAAVLIVSSLSWAFGSIYARQRPRPPSSAMATGMQMLGGSAALLVAAVIAGEPARLAASHVTLPSLLGLGYLITFGSIVGFTSYIYLLAHTTPAKASTYAYVNPVVAVVLGWAVAGEPVSSRTVVAAAIMLSGVAIISIFGGKR